MEENRKCQTVISQKSSWLLDGLVRESMHSVTVTTVGRPSIREKQKFLAGINGDGATPLAMAMSKVGRI